MAKCYGGKMFVGFNPAISTKAATGIRQEMRRWRLHLRSDLALGDLAKLANPALRGRIKLLRALLPAQRWVHGVIERHADLFAHWESLGTRLDDGSRMNREVHVRFWESVGGEIPPRHSTSALVIHGDVLR
jgi:hypothetical protein